MKTRKSIVLAMLLGFIFAGASMAQTDAMVYVVHGIPGTDLGLDAVLPVDIRVGETCAVENASFQQIAGPLALPAGLYVVEIRLANAEEPCSGPLAIAVQVSLALGEQATIVAHSTSEGAITATKFVNDLRAVPVDQTRLVARHTADAGAVDVVAQTGAGPEVVLFSDVENPDQVSATVASATYQVSINPAGGETPVFGAIELALQSQMIAFVYAVGSPVTGSFTLIPQVLAPTS
jgi:hypothetical protein